MTTKHTPGAWSVVEHSHAICVQTESPSKTKYGASRYAAIGGFDRNDREQLEEAHANARLIAAAPDLLEALKRCKFDSLNMTLEDREFCRAAIAKATGESE